MTFSKWQDYELNRKHWVETIPVWRIVTYCAVAYVAACLIGM